MTGAAMLVWFGVTVFVALIAWARAEVAKSRYTWLPPLFVLLASGALLTCIAR